eukprot:CAMPEP_0174843082 /NCGR_PEP_ID=MMETSP1114-20130205/10296_1 /TAXON_ID=312471 /ORGANISM="Neobodo designis, Strain CCAP 1951/1" /LENGTH=234 /DNA_ID=CAMNT_0016077295 /DNA_START=93 /DNA_END=800 /DNA_ORIENTATION=+
MSESNAAPLIEFVGSEGRKSDGSSPRSVAVCGADNSTGTDLRPMCGGRHGRAPLPWKSDRSPVNAAAAATTARPGASLARSGHRASDAVRDILFRTSSSPRATPAARPAGDDDGAASLESAGSDLIQRVSGRREGAAERGPGAVPDTLQRYPPDASPPQRRAAGSHSMVGAVFGENPSTSCHPAEAGGPPAAPSLTTAAMRVFETSLPPLSTSRGHSILEWCASTSQAPAADDG